VGPKPAAVDPDRDTRSGGSPAREQPLSRACGDHSCRLRRELRRRRSKGACFFLYGYKKVFFCMDTKKPVFRCKVPRPTVHGDTPLLNNITSNQRDLHLGHTRGQSRIPCRITKIVVHVCCGVLNDLFVDLFLYKIRSRRDSRASKKRDC
jgi:hypothetical protein